jgi:IS30 family transposase
VPKQRIKEAEKVLNYRPIKKFNYLHPNEKLKKECVALMG